MSALVAEPAGVTTAMRPLLAPDGTTVVTCVEELTTKLADVPSKATLEVSSRFVPLITTSVPTGPLCGEKEPIVGDPAGVTVKLLELVADPFPLVTVIAPVVADDGTAALI